MTRLDLLDAYDAFLRAKRGVADKTRAAYRYDLARFFGGLDDYRPLSEITPDEIMAFASRPGQSPATVRRTLASISGLMRWAVETGQIVSSPMAGVRLPSLPASVPSFLTPGQVRALLAAASTGEFSERDFGIISVFAFAGLRLNELTGLDVRDARPSSGEIRVRKGKGGTSRTVAMHPNARAGIERWLRVRERPRVETDALFVSRFGDRIANRTVEAMLVRRGEDAGISGLTPVMLRHTFATTLHANGVDLLQIRDLLGHKTVASTQIYAHACPKRLATAIDAIPE